MTEGEITTLVVLPRFPNRRTGSGQRGRLLVEAACRVGPTHVVLLDGARNLPAPAEVLPGVASLTALNSESVTPKQGFRRVLGGAARVLAPDRTYGVEPALQAALRELAVYHGASAVIFRYARLFCACGLTRDDGLRVLVDVDDRDDQKYRSRLESLFGPRLSGSWVWRRALDRLSALLRSRLSKASLVWFAAREDAWPLDGARTEILPNVPYWPAPDIPEPPSSAGSVMLFVGIHDHKPNRDGVAWMLDGVWPLVRDRMPGARLRIVGRGDWAAMAATQLDPGGIEFVGEVEDLAGEYAAARICVCPVREGGGSKIKVIEAAAFGRPVVVTPHAIRGFEGTPGLDIPQAADPEGFANGCLTLLRDADRADRAGAALRDWQRRNYSREAFLARVAEDLVGENEAAHAAWDDQEHARA